MHLFEILNDKKLDEQQKLAMIEQRLLENPDSLNQIDLNGATALYLSASQGYTTIVNRLIEKGAIIDQVNKNGFTPLYVAAKNGHTEAVLVLIEKGAEVDKPNKNGFTPLHVAAIRGHTEAVLVLIEKGADVNKANKYGFTPLYVAAQNGHTAVVNALIEKSMQPIKEIDKQSTWKNLFSFLGELLGREWSAIENLFSKLWPSTQLWPSAQSKMINQTIKDGYTPLCIATQNGHTETAKALIEKGADVNKANKDDCTPLHIAALCGHTEIALVLIEKGADVNKANKDGCTPLYAAALRGRTETALVLIEKGADVNKANKDGRTPLYIAALQGRTEVVNALIEKGAAINQVNKDGFTPLLMAAQNNHPRVINTLLAAPGIAVNQENENHQTPLEIYLAKIRQEADQGALSTDGYQTAQSTVALFLEKGADLDAALTHLNLTRHTEAIRLGNAFAGLILTQTQDAVIRNFIHRKQSTHDPLVHKTTYLSASTLKEHYPQLLDKKQVLALQAEIRAAAEKHAATAETESFLKKMSSANETDIPYWSGGLNMEQAVVCAWQAIHDQAIRYQSFANVKQDIADAENTFFQAVKQSAAVNECVRGGYFNQLMTVCASSQVPGVYVIRLESEKEVVVKELLFSKLAPLTAFELVPEAEKQKIFSDEETYQRFIAMLQKNHEQYQKYGNNQQIITDQNYLQPEGQIADWEWLSAEDFISIAEQLSWTSAQLKAAWEHKLATRPIITPIEEAKTHQFELRNWAKALQSKNPDGVWGRMSDYYNIHIKDLRIGKKTQAEVQAIMTQDSQELTELLKDTEAADLLLRDFFENKLEALEEAAQTNAGPLSETELLMETSAPGLTPHHDQTVRENADKTMSAENPIPSISAKQPGRSPSPSLE